MSGGAFFWRRGALGWRRFNVCFRRVRLGTSREGRGRLSRGLRALELRPCLVISIRFWRVGNVAGGGISDGWIFGGRRDHLGSGKWIGGSALSIRIIIRNFSAARFAIGSRKSG